MNEDKPITIDENTVRKMALNAETNPRKTIYGVATQTVNPLTGRPYEDGGKSKANSGYDGNFYPQSELKRLELTLAKSHFDYPGYSNLDDINKERIFSGGSTKKEKSLKKREYGNNEIELQKALGRMEVLRPSLSFLEERNEVWDFAFGRYLHTVDQLVDLYNSQPNLVLASITSLQGLERALEPFEIERMLMKFGEFDKYLPIGTYGMSGPGASRGSIYRKEIWKPNY